MTRQDKTDDSAKFKFFGKDGAPLKTLSTSLGIALLANAALGSASFAAEAKPSETAAVAQPKLVEWSSEAVKAFYDPAVDWNLPLAGDGDECKDGEDVVPCPPAAGSGTGSGTGTGSSGQTVIVNNGYHSGFGWDDLLLYHLIFNNGSSYSSSGWANSHTTYYAGTTRPYKAKSYDSETFRSKPVVGSAVRPKTTDKSGSVTRRSSSSKPGGIGGNSSGFSGSSSGSSKSKSVFGSSGSGGKSRSSGGFGG
ncbi:hypothetical protein [Cohnella hashimotonis]|uniref:Uncharacterized protein n=1 Tax=Cohnella hashimotonis TaxID=2826895 RepID=A0ABT6THB2_9BACL|nr:hypothetical protein [Cohnella hashimotonis]MDI4645976.1 hypothetical protein [Cohnella hashimotonis]